MGRKREVPLPECLPTRPPGTTVRRVKRLVLVGVLFGLLNAAAAVAALYGVGGAVPSEFGWFAYAPLNETVVYDSYGFPWKYVVVPAVLLTLNALLLPLAVRRGWLHR